MAALNRRDRSKDYDPIAGLPFVRNRSAEESAAFSIPRPRDFWDVQETGDFGRDNNLGRLLALECVRYMQERNFPPLLGWVVGDMIDKGRFGGVEIGFMSTIAGLAMRGARQ